MRPPRESAQKEGRCPAAPLRDQSICFLFKTKEIRKQQENVNKKKTPEAESGRTISKSNCRFEKSKILIEKQICDDKKQMEE